MRIIIWAAATSFLGLLFAVYNPARAIVPYGATWELSTTGDDTNGGGVTPGAAVNMAIAIGSGSSPDIPYPHKNTSGCTGCFSGSNDLSTTTACVAASATASSCGNASGSGIIPASPYLLCTNCSFDSNIVNQIVFISVASATATPSGSCAVFTNNPSTNPIPSPPFATHTDPQWRQVVAWNSSFPNIIQFDQAVVTATSGTCTGIIMNIGGALKSPGNLCNAMLNTNPPGYPQAVWYNLFYMKNDGMYYVTNSGVNAPGGIMNCIPFITNGEADYGPAGELLAGYTNKHLDWQTTVNPPVVHLCNTSPPFNDNLTNCPSGSVSFSSTYYSSAHPAVVMDWAQPQVGGQIFNVTTDCSNIPFAAGFYNGGNSEYAITAENCPAGGFGGASPLFNARSLNSTPGLVVSSCYFCVISGFSNGPGATLSTYDFLDEAATTGASIAQFIAFSLIYGSTGSNAHGYSSTLTPNTGNYSGMSAIMNTTIDSVAGDCVHLAVPTELMVINTICSNATGSALNNASTIANTPLFYGYNAEYNNGSADVFATPPTAVYSPGVGPFSGSNYQGIKTKVLTASPYVNASAHNYSTKSNSGLWCAGYPQAYGDGTQTCTDIGGLQHNWQSGGMAFGLPNLFPGADSLSDFMKAFRFVFSAKRGAQLASLQRSFQIGHNYEPLGDVVVFSVICGLLGIATAFVGRRARA